MKTLATDTNGNLIFVNDAKHRTTRATLPVVCAHCGTDTQGAVTVVADVGRICTPCRVHYLHPIDKNSHS